MGPSHTVEFQRDLRNFIKFVLDTRKERNRSYSLRAFARDLVITPSALSQFLSSKRNFSHPLALKILNKIDDDFQMKLHERKKLLEFLQNLAPEEVKKRNQKQHIEIAESDLEKLRDWHALAILALAEIKDFKGEKNWISKRLNIPPEAADLTLSVLEQIGCLVRDKKNNLRWSGKYYTNSNDITNRAIREVNRQCFTLVASKLDKVPVTKRDVSTAFFAADPNRLDEAKSMIANFRTRICNLLEGGNKTEVFSLSIGLMPMSENLKN